jgi:hypothetical protein
MKFGAMKGVARSLTFRAKERSLISKRKTPERVRRSAPMGGDYEIIH